MSLVRGDEEQRWVPTHVQVTVLRARGLRAKGKHGTSDVYTIIQLGKEKYSTCVMEKTTDPEWGEECSFELQPGILEEGGRDAYPPGSGDLTLTVMHRALIGLDVFLGQAVIQLDKAFQERICKKNQWYRLHSKTGKKEKERGELQLNVQFTRHNLTASMYDLSMKDKPLSAFDKLRERIRVKKRSNEEDSSSAIVAGGYGSLVRVRGRLPSDGGGEEDYEDDEGGEARRSKMRSFFLRGKLRKSSDTRSSTSLGSESSESSSRGGSLSPTAGISVVVSDLSNSPNHTVAPSPQVSPVRHMYTNEMCDFSLPVPHPMSSEKDTLILLPSVCLNGNPVETSPLTHHPPSIILQQPKLESTKPETQSGQPQAVELPAQPKKTQPTEPKSQTSTEIKLSKTASKPRPEPQLSALGLIPKGSNLSRSLQNLSPRVEERQNGGPADGRRWSFDKPGEEEKAAIVAALESAGRVTNESVMETVKPVGERETQSKKRKGLFSHGKGESPGKGPIRSKEEAEHAQQLVEGKHKGWFSSKDAHSKPSTLVSPKSDYHCPIAPFTFSDPSQNMDDKHAIPPPFSEANPLFPPVEQDLFFQEFPSDIPLTPAVPTLSSSVHFQSESTSSWFDGNLTPDLLRIDINGHSGISKENVPIDSFISNLETQTDEDDFGMFAEDRLKSSEKVNETENFVTTPTVLMKPNNQEPSGDLDSLTMLDTKDLTYLEKTASAGTSTGEMSKETPAHTPQVSGSEGNSNSNMPDLTGPEVFGFPGFAPDVSEISLPENSSLEFSELNALARPYPVLPHVSQNAHTATEDHPEIRLTSPNAQSSVTQPSLGEAEFFSTKLITSELSEDAGVTPEVSKDVEFPKDMKSVEDPVPCSTDVSSGDTEEQSKVTSDSTSRELDHQPIDPCQSPKSDIIPNNINHSNEGFLESNASLIDFTEPSGIHISSALSSPMSAALLVPMKNDDNSGAVTNTKTQNESKDGLLEIEEKEISVLGNLNDIPSSPALSKAVFDNINVDEQKACEFPNSPSKDVLTDDVLSNIDGGQEVKQSNGQAVPVGHFNPNIGVKLETSEDLFIPDSGSVLFHTMDKSADSEQYLTCVSQRDSISPSLELTQDAMPERDQSGEDASQFGPLPNHIAVPDIMPKNDTSINDCEPNQVTVEHLKPQKALPKNGDVLLNNCEPSVDIPQNASPKDMMPKMDISQDLIAELEAQLAPLKTETCLIDNCETSPFELNTLHSEQSARRESEVKLHFIDFTDPNVCVSNTASEQTSSITQDLVITDLNLQNIFVPQHNTCPVTRPESAETRNGLESHIKPAESLNKMHVTPAVTPDLFSVNWPPLSQQHPSAFDPQTLASTDNHSPYFPSSVFDLSPVASSTPQVAVGSNAWPEQFPFPIIPPTAEELWPDPAFTASNNHFLLEKTQTTNLQSSPHPVKPLTPPDDKKSEGRSVLDKLKSTIHSGRSHHSDQEADKKLLVEGGGSYYHLNHSELVNLLIQRDTELKREREEFERRGTLLEKREMELKKMKVVIRDLEDYIDTLLVRIMEQTPMLLQVRSRMK
ncbi:uncharacterized protein rab11fip5a isoform X2 [Paramisgurnus dabryanus]|uniref:uncharacterized protein rab11fip5a isoform X2 n=1 Tax=Paramisgurnus dabryanus TaxID=90735 RepID=UPI0031F43C88